MKQGQLSADTEQSSVVVCSRIKKKEIVEPPSCHGEERAVWAVTSLRQIEVHVTNATVALDNLFIPVTFTGGGGPLATFHK